MSELDRPPESSRPTEPAPPGEGPGAQTDRLRRETVVMMPDRGRNGLLLVAVALGGIGAGLGAAALLMPRVVIVQQLPASAPRPTCPRGAPGAPAPSAPGPYHAFHHHDFHYPSYAALPAASHPFLGVLVQSECENAGHRAADCAKPGAHVVQVYDDTAAHEAGIQPGDFIVDFDDKPVGSATDLVRLVREATPRAPVPVVVSRDGETKTVHAAPR